MFDGIKKRTIVNQLLIISLALLLLYAFGFIYNYITTLGNIDNVLDELQKTKFLNEKFEDTVSAADARDSVIIRVGLDDGNYTMSKSEFYEDEVVQKIIKASESMVTDHIIVNGARIAYLKTTELDATYYFIYVYDYSDNYLQFVYVAILLSILYSIGLAIVGITLFRFTKQNLAPLESAFVRQQELVANASHELKTPLTIINTNLQIINSNSETFSDEQKKWLGGIQTQVTRMTDMIIEMLELAKIEAKRNQDQVKFELGDLVQGVVLETEMVAFEKNILLTAEIKDKAYINARKADIEKLIYILIDNAIKYTPAGGLITIKLHTERRKVYLTVHNTGEGIPPEKLSKLFDRFYRGDEAHTLSNSYGLGLAIAKALVDNNNGTIGVESKVGQYTKFIAVFKEI